VASAAGVLASSLSSELESDPDESALAAFFGAGLSESDPDPDEDELEAALALAAAFFGAGLSESEESESEEDSTLDFFFGTTAFSAVF